MPQTEDLFVTEDGGDILWEPGAASVVYLKLHNAGNLSIKNELSVIAKDIVTGPDDDAALSQVLKTAVVDIEETEVGSYDRAKAITAAMAANSQSVLTYKNETAMEPGDISYLAMIVYFPENIGNAVGEYTYNRSDVQLQTELSLRLVAKQYVTEKDSFTDSDYDAEATYPYLPNVLKSRIATRVVPDNETELSDDSGVKAVLPADSLSEPTDVVFSVETTEVASESVTYEIKLTNNENQPITPNKPVTVTLPVGENLKNVVVKHYSTVMSADEAVYDPATGIVTITTSSFSPFTVSYETDFAAIINGTTYTDFIEALDATKSGDTVKLLKDVTLDKSEITTERYKYHYRFTDREVTIDLGGHTLAFEKPLNADYSFSGGILASGVGIHVKNGTINVNYGNGIYTTGAFTSTFENVAFHVNKKSYGAGVNAVGFTRFNNCTFDVNSGYGIFCSRPTTATNCTFDVDTFTGAGIQMNNRCNGNVLSDLTFNVTSGVAVYVNEYSDATLENIDITLAGRMNNTGIYVSSNSTAVIGGNVVVQNTSSSTYLDLVSGGLNFSNITIAEGYVSDYDGEVRNSTTGATPRSMVKGKLWRTAPRVDEGEFEDSFN